MNAYLAKPMPFCVARMSRQSDSPIGHGHRNPTLLLGLILATHLQPTPLNSPLFEHWRSRDGVCAAPQQMIGKVKRPKAVANMPPPYVVGGVQKSPEGGVQKSAFWTPPSPGKRLILINLVSAELTNRLSQALARRKVDFF